MCGAEWNRLLALRIISGRALACRLHLHALHTLVWAREATQGHPHVLRHGPTLPAMARRRPKGQRIWCKGTANFLLSRGRIASSRREVASTTPLPLRLRNCLRPHFTPKVKRTTCAPAFNVLLHAHIPRPNSRARTLQAQQARRPAGGGQQSTTTHDPAASSSPLPPSCTPPTTRGRARGTTTGTPSLPSSR